MKKFSDLFRKKVSETEKCEYQPSEEEKDYAKKMYTFSSIFVTEEQMKKAMEVINDSENKTEQRVNSEDEQER